MSRILSLSLKEEIYNNLDNIARMHGKTIYNVIRTAIDELIETEKMAIERTAIDEHFKVDAQDKIKK